MVHGVGSYLSLTTATVENTMTIEQIELAWHFAQRSKARDAEVEHALMRHAIADAISRTFGGVT
ncbi:MAG: hypothetical protein ACREM8_10790 [Vulcanimicrobiaceae bacterium]